jgi:membrane protease subunit HflK
VTGAQQDKQRLQVEAEGYRDEVVPRARGDARRKVAEAEGYRDSKILQAEGEATRFSALLAEYRKAPEVTRTRLHIETLEAVLPKMEKIILRDGSGDRVLPYLPLGRRATTGER